MLLLNLTIEAPMLQPEISSQLLHGLLASTAVTLGVVSFPSPFGSVVCANGATANGTDESAHSEAAPTTQRTMTTFIEPGKCLSSRTSMSINDRGPIIIATGQTCALAWFRIPVVLNIASEAVQWLYARVGRYAIANWQEGCARVCP